MFRQSTCSRLVFAAVLLSLSTGCTGTEAVDVDGFAPGACSDATGAVREIDATLIAADEEDLTPGEAGEELRAAQEVLKPIRDAAGDPLEQTFTDLIASLGFFRIAVDSNNYDGSQIADARAALDDLVEACTSS